MLARLTFLSRFSAPRTQRAPSASPLGGLHFQYHRLGAHWICRSGQEIILRVAGKGTFLVPSARAESFIR